MTYEVLDPDFEQRIRKSFARQGLTERLGCPCRRLRAVKRGLCDLVQR